LSVWYYAYYGITANDFNDLDITASPLRYYGSSSMNALCPLVIP
jgi:hypothetical protein